MKRISPAIAVFALLSGCVTGGLSSEMAAMQGKPVDAVIATWGAPEERRPAGDTTIFIWRDRAPARSPSGLFESAGAPVICERMLAIDDGGTVTSWRWRGKRCAVDEA